MIFKGKPIATLEAEIVALEKRRASLEARHAAATAAALGAQGERRRLLLEHDEPDAKALASADRSCRDAADAADAASDALSEVASRLAGARDRLGRLQDAEAREAQAAGLETAASKADAAIGRIMKAAADIDRARSDLAAAIVQGAEAAYAPPAGLTGWNGAALYLTAQVADFYNNAVNTSVLSPETVAARIVGHIISPVLPGLAVADQAEAQSAHVNGAVTKILAPVADSEAAKALLTNGMRAVAAKTRSSELQPA